MEGKEDKHQCCNMGVFKVKGVRQRCTAMHRSAIIFQQYSSQKSENFTLKHLTTFYGSP